MNNQTFDIDKISSFELPLDALRKSIEYCRNDPLTIATNQNDLIDLRHAIPIVEVYTIIDAILDRAKLEVESRHALFRELQPDDSMPELQPVSFAQWFVIHDVERAANAMIQNMRTKLSNMRRLMQTRGIPARQFRIEKSIVRRIPNHPLTLFRLNYTEDMKLNATRAALHVHLVLNSDDAALLKTIKR